MMADAGSELWVGIIQGEIDEAETTGVQIMPLGDGAELRLQPFSGLADDGPLLKAKLGAIGNTGVCAELGRTDVTLYADLDRLRQLDKPNRVITLPEDAIFTSPDRTGPLFACITVHVAAEYQA